MTEASGDFRLPDVLAASNTEVAVVGLRAYYAPLRGLNDGYTGGAWDTFDPSGTRASSAYHWTGDDVVSTALLSAPLYGRAAMDLLWLRRAEFSDLLLAIGPDRDLVDVEDPDGADYQAVHDLYAALRQLPGIGPTRATKLMARKRPRLVPIVDRVVRRTVFGDQPTQWSRLHAALVADGHALHHHLVALRRAAALPAAVSALRVFDVLAWMEGTDRLTSVQRGEALIAPSPEEGDD